MLQITRGEPHILTSPMYLAIYFTYDPTILCRQARKLVQITYQHKSALFWIVLCIQYPAEFDITCTL